MSRMITATLLTALLATQGASRLPENVAIVYSGVPGIVGAASPDVRMTGHSVNVDLAKDTATYTTLTLFHNDSAMPVRVALKVPMDSINPQIGRGYEIAFDVKLDNAPMRLSPYKEERTIVDDQVKLKNGASWRQYRRYRAADVTFKPKGTHVLRVVYTVPIGTAGLDGLQRMVAYDTVGLRSWKAPLDRLNFSIHYTSAVLFHAIGGEPALGWQIGDKGAFFKQDAFQPGEDTLVRFVYYRAGYDKIGKT